MIPKPRGVKASSMYWRSSSSKLENHQSLSWKWTDVAVDLPTRIMHRTVEQILNPGQRLAANPARVHKLNIASVSGKTTRRAIMPLLRNENISGVFPCNGK